MDQIYKYPRTRHLEGSGLQRGDEDLSIVPLRDIAGQFLVVEEKLDGANAAVSFSPRGDLRLQSRGHYLAGGGRERHFELFKAWAQVHRESLWGALGARYVMYGEWLYAKHTIFYDTLPHYFMEFDILDTRQGDFLSTERRQALLEGVPISPVPVLHSGPIGSSREIDGLVRPSPYKSPAWRQRLLDQATRRGLDPARCWRETDPSDLSEGLYIKVEEQGAVVARLKFVRAGFLATVIDSDSHWLSRPIVPNQLADGVDIFAGSP